MLLEKKRNPQEQVTSPAVANSSIYNHRKTHWSTTRLETMRFNALPIIVAGLSTASSLTPRSTISQVLQDVSNIDSHVLTLTQQIRSYQGGLPGILPQVDSLSSVYDALQDGVRDSGNLPNPISLLDAFNLVEQVNSTLAIDNPAAIDALIEKKQLYVNTGVSGTLAPILQQLLDGHEQFSKNILDRLAPDTPPEAVDLGKQVIEVISVALQKGIDAFSENQACD